MERKSPIRSIDWEVTTRCNYGCSYCTQSTYMQLQSGHAHDEVIDAVIAMLDRSGGSWLVKLSGGEPFVHPGFLAIARRLVSAGHSVCTTTNLSVPKRVLTEFFGITRGHLAFMTVSYHPSEVSSVEEFKEKAAYIAETKDEASDLTVTAVGVEEHENKLRDMAEWCDREGISFGVLPYKYRSGYVDYAPGPFRDFVEERMLPGSGEIRGRNTFGTMCHTGELFGRITLEGDVVRCYNLQPSFYVGNVKDPSFSWFAGPRPCLSSRCTCVVPVKRNIVEFGNRLPMGSALAAFTRACAVDTPRSSEFVGRWTGRYVRHVVRHPKDLLSGQ